MMYTNDQKLFYGDNGIGIVLIHGVTSGCAQMNPSDGCSMITVIPCTVLT